MLTSAIVFGMVGVAAGFTWDYILQPSFARPKSRHDSRTTRVSLPDSVDESARL
jgi:hypothetical protein